MKRKMGKWYAIGAVTAVAILFITSVANNVFGIREKFNGGGQKVTPETQKVKIEVEATQGPGSALAVGDGAAANNYNAPVGTINNFQKLDRTQTEDLAAAIVERMDTNRVWAVALYERIQILQKESEHQVDELAKKTSALAEATGAILSLSNKLATIDPPVQLTVLDQKRVASAIGVAKKLGGTSIGGGVTISGGVTIQ